MKKAIIFFPLLFMGMLANAEVRLPSYFTSNMVVQRNSELTIPGKARPGRKVTLAVSWDNEVLTAKAGADSSFMFKVQTPPAGGPFTITVSDGKKTVLKNVMSGDVWFCGGQSNMELTVSNVNNSKAEIAAADYPNIRLLQVTNAISLVPLDDAKMEEGGWRVCSPATISNFSALAYFFGRDLQKVIDIPIGLINSSWGGTGADAWTSHETLKEVKGFQEKMKIIEECGFDSHKLSLVCDRELDAWLAKFLDEHDPGVKDGKALWADEYQKSSEWSGITLPGVWEKEKNNNFDGTAWIQKEFSIPEDWSGESITLSLGTIDDNDITYLNGKVVARGRGNSVNREYSVPSEYVHKGKNLITVCIFDFGGDGGVHGEADKMFVLCDGRKLPLAGEWNFRFGASISEGPRRPVSPADHYYPSNLYNAMIHPLINFPVKGFLWYQGEHECGEHDLYRNLFEALIYDWRKSWKNEDLPFYYVEMPNWLEKKLYQEDSQWALLREAQDHVLKLPHTGMVCTIDCGDAVNDHPKDKQTVGERMARLALADTYGIGEYNLPMYKGYRIEGNRIIVTFSHEVMAKDGEPKGFVIAGTDGKFYPAKATIKGMEVILQSDEVNMPTAARYAWADNPDCNLYSKDGLAVPPFRTMN